MALIEVHSYRLPPDVTRAMGFVQQALDSIVGTLKRLRDLKTIDGVLLEKVPLSGTARRCVHGLGRAPQGWILARQNTNTTIWETSSDASSITLQAGAACTVNIWVY